MEKRLIVYHGSNRSFDEIDLSKSKNNRDFGVGFYTTTIREQAEDWGKALFDRYKGDGVFVYEMELIIADSLSIKYFNDLSEEWLALVQRNRTLGGIQHNFDIVQGPVANDKTTRTIGLYIAGIIDSSTAIERLRLNKVNDQVSIHTTAALSCIKLIRKYQHEG